MKRSWKNFKLDKNKVYQFIGQAVVYSSLYIGSIAFFYWAFLQRINLLILKERVEKEMLKAKKKENYEAMIENRNVLIADLQKKNEELSNENIAIYEENKELRFENEEQGELIDRIARVATANAYNNEKVILSKIKELISDYQSQN